MNIKDLVKIQIKEIKEDTIIWYPEIKDLCSRKYPNHLNGCPNIEKCESLNIPDFGIIQECAKFKCFYLVYAKFNFKQYKELRKIKHPTWSEKQLGNLYHWQNSIRAMIKKYINNLHLNGDHYVFGCGSGFKLNHQDRVGSMENSCINVFSTMRLNGIKLEINPKNWIYLVNLICSKKKLAVQKQTRLIIEAL